MLGWIVFGLGSLALAAAGWLCAVTIHFQDERHVRECGILLDYALDMDDRHAELAHGYDTLNLQLIEATSPKRTVPIKVVDAGIAEKPKRASRAKRTGQEQA